MLHFLRYQVSGTVETGELSVEEDRDNIATVIAGWMTFITISAESEERRWRRQHLAA